MNLLEVFSTQWGESLGWTLLHSIWQVGVVLLLVFVVIRLIPTQFAHLRYGIACTGLLGICIAGVVTFLQLLPASDKTSTLPSFRAAHDFIFTNTDNPSHFSIKNILAQVHTWLEEYMGFIILAWIAGVLFFLVRLLLGWLHVAKLKREALLVDNEWSLLLRQLAFKLRINKSVQLAESIHIHSPMVVGYLKPIVLVPIGMCTGLTSEELETIFVHELAHIKRHDYLVNLLQCLVESILFFNPFVWILSSIIRREREYCCDDTVIRKHGSALAYAYALTRLAENRFSENVIALTLGKNQNQLLTRIKRFLEKPGKSNTNWDRVIPVVLILVGLISTSWLTIKKENYETQLEILPILDQQDTTGKNSKKSARNTQKKMTRIDIDGKQHEEITEEFEVDEDLQSILLIPPLPEIPVIDLPSGTPVVPALPLFPAFTISLNSLHPLIDTIPIQHWNREDWEQFNETLHEHLQERLHDITIDQEVLQERIEELSRQLEKGLSNTDIAQLTERAKKHEATGLQESMKHLRDWEQDHTQQMEEWQMQMQHWEKEHLNHLKELEIQLKDFEAHMKDFEKELKEELVQDGYLKKNEQIKNLHWDDNGELNVNGKKIKERDHQKYKEIFQRYHPNKSRNHYRRVE